MCFLIGVDVGTQGSKGVIVSEAGQVLAFHSIEQTVSLPRPGWAEHDADAAWWSGFVEVVRVLLARSGIDPRDVSAVGVSALMPVMLPVDDRGKPLRPAILYADTRAHDEMTMMNRHLAGRGLRPTVAHDVGPKIVWFRDHEPDQWQKTRSIIGAQGYVAFKLTGRTVIDQFTSLGFHPFIDPDRYEWDAVTCDLFGIPSEFLPEVVQMTDVIGTVTTAAATETGLAEGTAVIGGATDFIAEIISTGAQADGDVVVTYGTTFCLVAFSQTPIGSCPGLAPILQRNDELLRLYPDLYSVGGGMATSGALARWFRDQFGQAEHRLEQNLGQNAYGALGQEAEAVPPGAEGLVVLPYFSGERSPIHDDLARGVIFGLTLAHSRGHVYRALLEGVAYGVQHHLQLMREAGVTPRRIVATGGGSRSRLWTQIVSDVTGLPQEVISPSNAALGAAFLAGYAVGAFGEISDVRRWARAEEEVYPRPGIHDEYQRYYEIYRRLYERTKEEMHDLARLGTEAPRMPERPDLAMQPR
jgi:xylulokinase